MGLKYFLLVIVLLSGLLDAQTIRRSVPLNDYTKEYIYKQANLKAAPDVNKLNAAPSFIRYDLNIVELGNSPYEVCIPPASDYAFCTVPLENAVIVISLINGSIIDTINLKYRPEKMIMSENGSRIYVSTNEWDYNVGPGCVYTINTSNYNDITEMFPYATPQIPSVNVGPFYDLMLDESKSLMYLVNDMWIYVMNTDQNLLVDVIDIPQAAGYFNTFALNKRRIFGLAEVIGCPFYMINLDTKETKYLQPGGNYMFQSSSIPISSPDGSKVFVTVFDNRFRAVGMDVFNAETGKFEAFIPKLTTLGGFVYNKDSTLAYLNQGEYIVTYSQIFNLSTLSKVGSIPSGGYSGTSSKDDRFLYFAKFASCKRSQLDLGSSINLDLSVMDLNANYGFSIDVTTEKTYSCLFRSIAVSEDNRHVVITNPSLNSVSIVSDIQGLVPAAVLLISPNDSLNIASTQITFNWSSLPDVTNYHIQISDTSSFSSIYYQDSVITQDSISINSFQKNRRYFWRVRAKNIIGWGNWSQAGIFNTKDNDLPVELISFNANQIKHAIELNWSTITEINNYGFEIHRSFRNRDADWQMIGFIKGAGTSADKHDYLFRDINISSGKYYYRLKQIDLDGTSWYLDTISVETDFLPEEYSVSQNFPNPFNPSTTIRYSVPKPGFVSIKIYDLLGREVTTLVNENLSAGSYNTEFDAGKLLSGVYFYKMEAGDFSEIKKFILLK